MSHSTEYCVIAIDGPAASGKSSVARSLAKRLEFAHVNSGAMYRAMAWLVHQRGVEPTNAPDIMREIEASRFEFGLRNRESFILIDGFNPETHLKDQDVNRTVSAVSSIPAVRTFLLKYLRSFTALDDVVMEGRDIGSTVFPETPYKFYIDASPDIRAQRRAAQGLDDDLVYRDKIDSSRRTSPLTIAEDAHVIDSSHLTIDGVVGEIIGRLKIKGLPQALRL